MASVGPPPPRQRRSRETLERVLAAAQDVFAELGEDGFTMAEVSRRSGASVGGIYRRFASKEDLLVAMLDRVAAADEAETIAALATRDWTTCTDRELVDHLIAGLATTWRRQAPLMRALMARRLRGIDDAVNDQGHRVMAQQARAFTTVVLLRRDRITAPQPEAAADFAFRLVTAACGRWTAETIETRAPAPMDWPTMLAHLGDTIEAYLFGTTSGTTTKG